MYVDILNIDEFVKAYDLKEITSTDLFVPNSSEADPNGLVSYEIFGVPGTQERKINWGYINLNTYFITPHAFREFRRIYTKNFTDFIKGTVEFGINSKTNELEKVSSGGTYITTGNTIKWLYDNWDKIYWPDKKACAVSTSMSRRFLKYVEKDSIFCSKWPVMPAFYRDVDIQTRKKNEINKFYIKLMNASAAIAPMITMFGEKGSINMISMVQNILNELYDFVTKMTIGVHSLMNEHVLGKNIDYSSRMIITSTDINSETCEDMETDFTHSAVPLHTVINVFSPFIIHGMVNVIENNLLSGNDFMLVKDEGTKSLRRVKLSTYWRQFISYDNVSKNIIRYSKDRSFRLEKPMIETEEGPKPILMEEGDDIVELTWCELFYIVAEETVADKHVYITRYPIEDHNSTYPSKMNIIPSSKYLNRFGYKRYPDLRFADDKGIDHFFTDSLRLSPLYLACLQADFDGDQLNLQGVFTREANEEAEKRLTGLTNLVRVDGEPIRVFKDLGSLALFSLTSKPNDF